MARDIVPQKRRGSFRSAAVLSGWLAAFAATLLLLALPPARAAEKPKDRAASFAALWSHLRLGEGAVAADIGAGGGQDTWLMAALAGEKGTVYSEEIGEGAVKKLAAEAEKRGLKQVRAVLGKNDDPGLPADAVDFAYMHFVYHHFSQPREMLRGIYRGLKPGGYLVIVDQRRGTLREWVPREQRKDKHTWTAETTVVREAREEGFLFVECAEDYWHEKDPFVLVFRRPKQARPAGGDPRRVPTTPGRRGHSVAGGPPLSEPRVCRDRGIARVDRAAAEELGRQRERNHP